MARKKVTNNSWSNLANDTGGSIFPSFSPRYFYFQSLGTSNPIPSHGRGWNEAIALRNAASAYLGSVNLNNNDKNDSTSSMSLALNFLSQAATTEAKNEAKFFQELLKDVDLQNNPLLQQLAKCFSNDGVVDYLTFMSIMRTLQSGKGEAEKQLQATLRQAGAFNQAIQPILEKTQIDVKHLKDPSFLIANIFKDDESRQAQRIAPRSKALKTTSVLGNALTGLHHSADASQFADLLNDKVEALLTSGRLTYDANSIPSKFRRSIASKLEIGQKLIEMAYEELESDENYDPKVNEVYTRATEILDDLADTHKKLTDKRVTQLKNLSQHAESFFSDLDLLSQQNRESTKQVEKIKVGKSEDDLIGFTAEVRKVIAEIYSEFNFTDDPNDPSSLSHAQKVITNAANKDTPLRSKQERKNYQEALKRLIDNARGSANTSAKKKLKTEDYAKILNQQIRSQFKLTMWAETEFGAVRGFNDIVKALEAKMSNLHVGQVNGRADSISSIIIGKANLAVEMDMDETLLDNWQSRFIHNYERYYEEAYTNELKKVREQSEEILLNQLGLNNLQELRGKEKLFNSNEAYSVLADASAHRTAWKHAMDNLIRCIKRKVKDQERQTKIINSLNNLFVVENSVKHSDYNIIGRGFSGGSLGASLAEQLLNIQELGSLGGLSMPDVAWLTFAVLNCGSGMIGAGNKKSLEDYFSIFATMLMFRSASDLMEQVQSHASNFTASSAGHTIRLYTFQNTYVTSSYILSKTYEAMTQIAAATEASAAYQSQAVIQNNISEPTYHPWPGPQIFGEFATANFGAVSINVQLLAGFLDLIDNLEQIVSKLPI